MRGMRWMLLAVVGAVALAGCSAPASTTVAAGTLASSTQPPAPECGGKALTGSVTLAGSNASQPYVVVALKNASTSACSMSGYPVVTFADAAGKPIGVAITHGSTYEVADPGEAVADLKPGGSAWFAIGTGTAYGGPMVDLTTARVSLGGSETAVKVDLVGDAAKSADPLPVSVTAFSASVPPH